MSTTSWMVVYLIGAAFLLWVGFGRGLKTLLGGVLAEWYLEGSELKSDRALRRSARIALLLLTILFISGMVFPWLRSWGWAL